MLEHSKSKGGALLVLLTLSYHADKHGGNAYPSLKKLILETKLGERQIRYHLTALEKMGEIRREVKAGDGWANVYTILLPINGVGQWIAPCEHEAVGQSTAGPDDEWGNPLPQGGAISSRGVGQSTAPQESYRRIKEEVLEERGDVNPRSRDPRFPIQNYQVSSNGAHSPPKRNPADIPTPLPLSADFTLTPMRQKWAEEQASEHSVELDVGLAFKKFSNYFFRGKGKSTELDDWDGRWERWVLDDIAKAPSKQRNAKGKGNAENNRSRRALAIAERFKERTGAELDEVSFTGVGAAAGDDQGRLGP